MFLCREEEEDCCSVLCVCVWSPALGSKSRGRSLWALSQHITINHRGFAGLWSGSWYLSFPPHLFSLLHVDGFSTFCEEYTTARAIITAVICHYVSPSTKVLNILQDKKPLKQTVCPGANNRVDHRASLNQQLVNWILWRTVKFTVFSGALPLSRRQQSPPNWPLGSTTPVSALVSHRQGSSHNNSLCSRYLLCKRWSSLCSSALRRQTSPLTPAVRCCTSFMLVV